MKALTRTLALVATATGVAALGSSAYATTTAKGYTSYAGTKTFEEVVRFGDLDLGTQQGADHLFARIRTAAREVCGDTADPLQFYERSSIRHCEHTAIENAVAEVDRPKVTAVYDQHYPNQPLAYTGRVSAGYTDAVTIVAG